MGMVTRSRRYGCAKSPSHHIPGVHLSILLQKEERFYAYCSMLIFCIRTSLDDKSICYVKSTRCYAAPGGVVYLTRLNKNRQHQTYDNQDSTIHWTALPSRPCLHESHRIFYGVEQDQPMFVRVVYGESPNPGSSRSTIRTASTHYLRSLST